MRGRRAWTEAEAPVVDKASQEPHCSLAASATKAPRGWNVLLLAVVFHI